MRVWFKLKRLKKKSRNNQESVNWNTAYSVSSKQVYCFYPITNRRQDKYRTRVGLFFGANFPATLRKRVECYLLAGLYFTHAKSLGEAFLVCFSFPSIKQDKLFIHYCDYTSAFLNFYQKMGKFILNILCLAFINHKRLIIQIIE